MKEFAYLFMNDADTFVSVTGGLFTTVFFLASVIFIIRNKEKRRRDEKW